MTPTSPAGLIKWVVDCEKRTRNAAVLLSIIITGAVLIIGELCAAIAFLSLSPIVGIVVGLLSAVPAGLAGYRWWIRRRLPPA